MSSSPITAMCILREGKILLGFKNGSLGIKEGNSVRLIGSSTGCIHHFAIWNTYIVLSNAKGVIEIWNVENGEKVKFIHADSKGGIYDFDICNDIVYFATHCSHSSIYAYDLKTGELVCKSQEQRRHVKSVKILNQEPQTLIIGYPEGIELFSLDLQAISMISLLNMSKSCCSSSQMKAKFIDVSEDDRLIAAVMKSKNSNKWFLYEFDVDSLLLLNQRPITKNKKLQSGREITHLCSSEGSWYITVKKGIYMFEMNSKKAARSISSTHDSNNSYSILYEKQWIQGYEDGTCLVSDLFPEEVAYL